LYLSLASILKIKIKLPLLTLDTYSPSLKTPLRLILINGTKYQPPPPPTNPPFSKQKIHTPFTYLFSPSTNYFHPHLHFSTPGSLTLAGKPPYTLTVVSSGGKWSTLFIPQ